MLFEEITLHAKVKSGLSDTLYKFIRRDFLSVTVEYLKMDNLYITKNL